MKNPSLHRDAASAFFNLPGGRVFAVGEHPERGLLGRHGDRRTQLKYFCRGEAGVANARTEAAHTSIQNV